MEQFIKPTQKLSLSYNIYSIQIKIFYIYMKFTYINILIFVKFKK